ncbi:MAG TPA: tRNA uridine-5-carboxymethylaminomethyl(34) synthesis GTPase MnmE [Candidatus Angelobacter sp.]|nr:tRNA uridine-5-carboxymethylaminomethyl(34) synthesis GTPase MnmE [Candidatus Angelobacter sp.]
MNLDDTIVAVATPPGRGGIGVVRLSGPEVRAIAAPLLRLKHELQPGRAVFTELIEPASGERVDEVVVAYFAKPHSYTTDDVVEISAHGSPVVLRHIVELATGAGARLAEPGEFTMRAFLNGRIDLTQAEAVRDLIESQTLYQAKVAAQQLEGALSKRLQPIKRKLVELIAVMEAGIDFAEDDVAVLPGREIMARLDEIQPPLEQLRASFAYGKIVHEGLTLAIVGRPNVGKSSLFNRLVERERAIVTATPGTTRDLVTETVALGGIPIKLVDTAGIRHSTDEAESIGIRKSYEALSEADMVLVVLDSTRDIGTEDQELVGACTGRRALAVANKSDLKGARALRVDGFKVFRTSAITGEGMEALREEILTQISGPAGGEHESGFLTNIRHQRLVEESLTFLAAARQAVERKTPHEMIMLDLYGALRPLDSITGETTTDDILNLIFSSFCIGK